MALRLHLIISQLSSSIVCIYYRAVDKGGVFFLGGGFRYLWLFSLLVFKSRDFG